EVGWPEHASPSIISFPNEQTVVGKFIDFRFNFAKAVSERLCVFLIPANEQAEIQSRKAADQQWDPPCCIRVRKCKSNIRHLGCRKYPKSLSYVTARSQNLCPERIIFSEQNWDLARSIHSRALIHRAIDPPPSSGQMYHASPQGLASPRSEAGSCRRFATIKLRHDPRVANLAARNWFP